MPHSIFPSLLSLPALKWGPYKTTAHAVAELIDNSADADAEECGVVIFVEGSNPLPVMIATLDNGVGMDEEKLAICLQYGYGENPSEKTRQTPRMKRLGRFGVGLLSASFSQCQEVQVMSWQKNQPSKKVSIPFVQLTSYEDDENVRKNQIPDVAYEQLPDWTSKAFVGMPTHISEMQSGTLVIWRNLSPSWKRSSTLQENLLKLCGRIHREFIRLNLMSISVMVYDLESGECEKTRQAQPIDPTFLNNWDTNALKNFGFVGDNTLFCPFTGHEGDSGLNAEGEYPGETREFKSPEGTVVGKYTLKASYRSDAVLNDEELKKEYDDPGNAPYGKLAKELQGVSFLRASREITLDDGWLRLSKSVDRWVSVSVDFDPSLDQVVGISNDKQQVRSLSELAPKSITDVQDEISRVRRENVADEWEYFARLQIAHHIKKRLQEMQKFVKVQRIGSRTSEPDSIEQTDPTFAPISELRVDGDRMSEGDREIPVDSHLPSEDPNGTREVYGESMSGTQSAKEVRPREIMKHDLKIDYVRDPYSPPSRMFHHTVGTGHMVVHFHGKHPLSDVLTRLLLDESDSESADEEDELPPPTMQDAIRVIRGLIASYARVQAEADDYDESEAAALERTLISWSEKASYVFRNRED